MAEVSPRKDEGGPVPPRAFSGADLGVHLVVCVLVGGGLGYASDRFIGGAPWGMLGGLMLGFGAWLRVVWSLLARK